VYELQNVSAIKAPQSVRADNFTAKTDMEAGVMQPIGFSPYLRMDSGQGRITFMAKMNETVRMPENGVALTVQSWFVPRLAFKRFHDLTMYNESYEGVQSANGQVVPFFEKNKYWNGTTEITATNADNFDTTVGYHVSNFYKKLGMHIEDDWNTDMVESYNAVVNYVYQMLSKSLEERNSFDHSLAPCPWPLNDMRYIVPTFDDAMIDGRIPLNIAAQAPIKSNMIGNFNPGSTSYSNGWQADPGVTGITPISTTGSAVTKEGNVFEFSNIWAEIGASSAYITTDMIEAAKKTASFARLRAMYSDRVTDDHLVNMAINAIELPHEELDKPRLLNSQTTSFGYNQNYATNSGALDESVTRGMAAVDYGYVVPRTNTGGNVVHIANIAPERIMERKRDYYYSATTKAELPEFVRDYTDTQKVQIVRNKEIDVDHTDPEGIFGYAPLNHSFNRTNQFRVGGRFMRQASDAYNEERASIWSAETATANTSLNEDFYLVTGLHKKIFADQNQPGFDVLAKQQSRITGNTVFGEPLMESDGDYEAVELMLDDTQLEGDGAE
jgi:hypothetical protein